MMLREKSKDIMAGPSMNKTFIREGGASKNGA